MPHKSHADFWFKALPKLLSLLAVRVHEMWSITRELIKGTVILSNSRASLSEVPEFRLFLFSIAIRNVFLINFFLEVFPSKFVPLLISHSSFYRLPPIVCIVNQLKLSTCKLFLIRARHVIKYSVQRSNPFFCIYWVT